MRVQFKARWNFTVAFVSCLLFAFSANADEWKAGVARAKITPTKPMPMAGYASRGSKPAEGTLTDLWAKVLVLQDAKGNSAALITLDLVGVEHELSKSICDRIQREQKWQRSQIAICTSHTHTGPVVAKNLRPMHYLQLDDADRVLVDEYATFLEEAIVKSVAAAVADLKPAKLTWGSGRATFAVNRRENKEPDVPQLRKTGELKGPSDHDVPVMAVSRGDQLAAIVFGYACHSTTLSSMQWSGDYAGFTQIDLEKDYPGAQAMFWAGCGGDQNPLPRRTVELCREYGKQLADAVSTVLHGEMKPVPPTLRTAYSEADIPFGTLPTKEQIQADTKSSNIYIASRARSLLKQLERGESLISVYDYPVEVWNLGDVVTFVFLGGEVVVDYAIRIKEELSGENAGADPTSIWCAGYANDVMAYIPSKRVLLEGGYEGGGAMVYYGLPAPWGPDVEELIVQAVHHTAKEVTSEKK